MAKLTWLEDGKRKFKVGVDKTVLFVKDVENKTWKNGVAWHGVTSVNDGAGGADENKYFANNRCYATVRGMETLEPSIEAYYSPDEFDECDGCVEAAPGLKLTGQTRVPFSFAYRKWIGEDSEGTRSDYEIHILYNMTASPTEETADTINESVDLETMSWDCSATPIEVSGYEPTARMVIVASRCTAANLKALEDMLWGTDNDNSTLPLPDQVIALLNTGSITPDPDEETPGDETPGEE